MAEFHVFSYGVECPFALKPHVGEIQKYKVLAAYRAVHVKFTSTLT